MNVFHSNDVQWPAGKPVTRERKPFGPFQKGGKDLNLFQAVDRVTREVSAFTRNGRNWRTTELWVYVGGAKVGKQRTFLADQKKTLTPGVVVSFDIDGKPYTIAVDAFQDPAQNLAAIAQAIEAMRATERYGVFTIAELMQSFAQLPASTGMELSRRSPFDDLSTEDGVTALYRELAKTAHPDHGGSNAAMAQLNQQRDEAMQRVAK